MNTILWKKYTVLTVVIATSMMISNLSFSLNTFVDTGGHAVSTDNNKRLTRRGYRANKQTLIAYTGHANQTIRTGRIRNHSSKKSPRANTDHTLLATSAGRARNR